MSDDTLPPPPPAKPAEISKARRLALAFEEVFGQAPRRSSSQRLVTDHLRYMCGRDTPVFVPDKAGSFDPLRAAHKDGAQTQYLIIKRQLAVARKTREEAKPKKRAVR